MQRVVVPLHLSKAAVHHGEGRSQNDGAEMPRTHHAPSGQRGPLFARQPAQPATSPTLHLSFSTVIVVLGCCCFVLLVTLKSPLRREGRKPHPRGAKLTATPSHQPSIGPETRKRQRRDATRVVGHGPPSPGDAKTEVAEPTTVNKLTPMGLTRRPRGEGQVATEDESSLVCIGWRQTAGCRGYGRREKYLDRPCSAYIEVGRSGYCECRDEVAQAVVLTGRVDCDHRPFSCSDACAVGRRFDATNDDVNTGSHTCVSFKREATCDQHATDVDRTAVLALMHCEVVIVPGMSGTCHCRRPPDGTSHERAVSAADADGSAGNVQISAADVAEEGPKGGGGAMPGRGGGPSSFVLAIPCDHEPTTCAVSCLFGRITPLRAVALGVDERPPRTDQPSSSDYQLAPYGEAAPSDDETYPRDLAGNKAGAWGAGLPLGRGAPTQRSSGGLQGTKLSTVSSLSTSCLVT